MAETTKVGNIEVDLTLNTNKFKQGVATANTELTKLQAACKKAGNAGSYVSEGFSQITSKITNLINPANVVAAGITAIGAACVAVVKIGDEMCGVFDDLQVATGALGESLEGLNESLKKTIGNTSSTADKLGTAMGNLNTYLGITGEELESLTSLFAKYSDITGANVADSTAKASKAFNLWGVEVKDMSNTLNVFYGVSQATGITVEALFAAVTDGAAFMKRFGYSIEEAAVELASFEKYGISSATVITGMKMAVSNMTAQGIEPNKEAWDALKESIAKATSDTEAMSIATEAFGSRYAAQMVDAIKLADKAIGGLNDNLDSMNTALDESIKMQEEGGLAEAWTKLSNKMALGAQSFFEAIEPALTWLVNALITLLDILDPIFRFIGMIIDVALIPLKAILAVVTNMLDWLKKNVLDPILEWVNNFLDAIQPVIDFFNGIGEGIANLLGFTDEGGKEAEKAMDKVGESVDNATKSMDAYCDSIDTAISKTKELSAASSKGEDPYVNTGMNYHIENGYKIYADGTRVKDGGTTYNNSITVQGGGYPSEEMARIYAYNQALNSLKARY